ncbi:hypothetical protein F5884DRAFT_471946 [Xylogone sp. PMI_703]|nr:hypothetical protein F5884DRAFT_471946 [Xylogone sp. PMI_703]
MTAFPKLPPSGINVIIVGAGFAGLAAAIECDRKGHSVILLEKADDIVELQRIGDIISFDANGSRIFQKWPGVLDALYPVIRRTNWLDLYKWTGEYMTRQSFAEEAKWGQRVNGHRGDLHRVIYQHVIDRGIDVRLGQRVTDYFEDEKEAGVIVNDTRITADVVLAAEGVRSRGRKIVLGFDDNPKASGYAVYRAWFPSDELAKNEKTKHLMVNGDTHQTWVGPDIHFISSSIKGGKEINWVFTHKDNYDIEESWQFPGTVEEALQFLQGWDPTILEIVKATPPGRLIDHKLVFRDPLPTFISPLRRIALIGDAAHPFLPTSIQGASQALEDATTIAVCLELGGKANVTQSVRAYEKIRYERVHKAQATGVATRERWHKANWDEISKDPTRLHLVREEWLLGFDAEANAYATYNDVVSKLS